MKTVKKKMKKLFAVLSVIMLVISIRVTAEVLIPNRRQEIISTSTSPYVVNAEIDRLQQDEQAFDTITFSEFPVGTYITYQYSDRGIIFGGDSPYIYKDGSNPTSPVLTGTPLFHGAIEGSFVNPIDGITPITISAFSLDAGYFNSLGSTRIEWFDQYGSKLGEQVNSTLGIERFNIEGCNCNFSSWRIEIIESETAGFAIDNLNIGNVIIITPITLSKIDDINDGECVGLGDEITYRIDYSYPDEPNYFGFEDLADFVQWWLVDDCSFNNDCNGMDVNIDGTVNFIDFAMLSDNWLKGEVLKDVIIIDELPPEAEFVSADSDGIYDRCLHDVRWYIEMLEPGESGFVTLKVSVKCAETDRIFRNYCKIKSGDQILDIACEDTPKCGASDPRPADNAMDMPADVVLSWVPGPKADKHDVYFGTDESSVAEANRSNPLGVLLGLNQDANTYDPCGLLELGRRYYWRIDEVNDPNIFKDCVWSFTTYSQPVEIIGLWSAGESHAKEPGTNRALLLIAHAEKLGAVSLDSVTYGGQPMTKIIDVNLCTNCDAYVAAFMLDEAGINAATDSNFAFTWSAAPFNSAYGSVFLQNVNQIVPVGAGDKKCQMSGSVISTAPLAADSGDMVVDAATNSSVGSYTVLNGFTEALELSIFNADAVEGYKHATGVDETPSVSHNYGARQALIGFVVRKADILIDCGEVQAANYGLLSDLNGDCYVDYKDLDIIQDCWLNTDCTEPGNCRCADFEPADGTVDLFDFSDFAKQWLWCNDPEDADCTPNWP
jgi:hypothetical protein